MDPMPRDRRVDRLYAAGLRFLDAGISIIPTALDKRPYGPALPLDRESQKRSWNGYRGRIATKEELRTWLAYRAVRGLAAVCGAVSGNLLALDFDSPHSYQTWRDHIGHDDWLALTVEQQSGSGTGHHHLFRCEHPGVSRKLAFVKQRDGSFKTGIETKAEGGYIILAPSENGTGPYTLLSGDWATLPIIPQEVVQRWLQVALALNERPLTHAAPSTPRRGVRHALPPGQQQWITAYNERHSTVDELRRHGYKQLNALTLEHPNAQTPDGSVHIHPQSGRSKHHSTNDPLWTEMGQGGHDAFSVRCVLEFGGDIYRCLDAVKDELLWTAGRMDTDTGRRWPQSARSSLSRMSRATLSRR